MAVVLALDPTTVTLVRESGRPERIAWRRRSAPLGHGVEATETLEEVVEAGAQLADLHDVVDAPIEERPGALEIR
jgi:hypothetical protein